MDFKEIKPVNPKEINPEYSLEGVAEAEAPILWPPDERVDSMEKTLMLEKNKGKKRR